MLTVMFLKCNRASAKRQKDDINGRLCGVQVPKRAIILHVCVFYFFKKKQGICNNAGIIAPTPMGMANLYFPRNSSAKYMMLKSVARILAIIPNVRISLAESFLASESIGLEIQMVTVEITTPAEGNSTLLVFIRSFIAIKETIIIALEKQKQILGDSRWNPPLNLRMSMKGIIINMPSSNNPKMELYISVRKTGNKPNNRLYTANSYRLLSSPFITLALTSQADTISAILRITLLC